MMERTTRTPSAADEPRFALGRTFITPAAMAAIHPEDVADCLGRHSRGDWGECDSKDAAANEYAVPRTLRVFSVYRDRGGTKFWVITEADRSATTVLLPDDY